MVFENFITCEEDHGVTEGCGKVVRGLSYRNRGHLGPKKAVPIIVKECYKIVESGHNAKVWV